MAMIKTNTPAKAVSRKNKKQKITVPHIVSLKRKQQKIVMLTAYDATFASIVDQSNVDIVLVGDSLGMVILGHQNTVPVTLEDIIYHCRAVSRGLKFAHLCGDMPFMSYKISKEQALESASKIMQNGRAESVKLEGGQEMAATISALVSSGIPVMGHIGLTPQSIHAMGGFKMQGKSGVDQVKIIEDAKAVAEAGAFCVVLEGMPLELAQIITEKINIPTIGIGAGPHCDGQVLVIYDMLGLNDGFKPAFLKTYQNFHNLAKEAIGNYSNDVRLNKFPAKENSVSIKIDAPDEIVPYGSVNKDSD